MHIYVVFYVIVYDTGDIILKYSCTRFVSLARNKSCLAIVSQILVVSISIV